MGPTELFSVLLALSCLAVGIILLIFWAVRRSERERAQAVLRISVPGQHAKVSYLNKLRRVRGPANLALWGEIGDQLDMKSGWQRTPDIVLDVLEQNPNLVVDFLLERHGIEKIRRLVEEIRDDDGD